MLISLPTLYSANKNGSINHWTIQIDTTKGLSRTVYGKTGGKTTTSEWYASQAKNVGRSNATSAGEQAVAESKVVWQRKVDKGASENLSSIETTATEISGGAKRKKENCMLAAKWVDIKAKAVKKGSMKDLFPCFCQPKLDGMRALISLDANGEVSAVSRNNKPWITVPHILAALKPMLKANPGMVLDGELYNHEMHDDFDEIASIIKRKNPTAEDFAKSKQLVSFYWYDIADDLMPFVDRMVRQKDLFQKFISPKNPGDCIAPVTIVSTDLISSEEQLDERYYEYLEDGYEGQMVRYNTPYEFDRSKNLLKRKEFQDDEFQVISILEGDGNKTGQAAKGFLRLPDGTTSRFNIKGKSPWRKLLLANKDKVIGKWAICQFQNWTPKGGLRFPYLFAIEQAPYLRLRAGKGKDN